MGSMSFIHKPNTVIEIQTAKEMLAKLYKTAKSTSNKTTLKEAKEIEADIEADAKDGHAKPMYLNIIKGRYTGTKKIPLQYYGAFGYYVGGKNKRYNDIYDLFE